MLIRLLDLVFSLVGLIAGFPLLLVLWVVGLLENGSPLFRQERVGRNQKPFVLLKFRTMRCGTPSVPTHLADASAISAYGRFLRRTKLDELPQLWNVLTGDMSIVGPRPSLMTQVELIRARASRGVLAARPGVTGLAQIRGIDMSTPEQLAETDAEMLKSLSPSTYVWIIVQTLRGKGSGDRTQRQSD